MCECFFDIYSVGNSTETEMYKDGLNHQLYWFLYIHLSGITLWPPAYYCVCCQNSPDPSRCRLHSTRGCTLAYSTKTLAADAARLGLHGSDWYVQHTHRFSIGLRSGEFGGQVNINLLCSSNHSWTIFAWWHSALFRWKRPQPSGNTVSMKGFIWSATMLR